MPGVDFTSIQEALDQSDPGETVYVLSGEYHESLNLRKPGVILQGVDTGEGSPVVSAAGNSNTITITASNCTVDGFVVMNFGNQEVERPQDTPTETRNVETPIDAPAETQDIETPRDTLAEIQDFKTPIDTPTETQDVETPIDTPTETQDVETPIDTPTETQDVETPIDTPTETRWIGIAVLSDGNTISNNAITGCKGNGLELSRSNGNAIQGNRISGNGLDGISLRGSSDNILSSNSVTENGMNGLHLQDSDNNIIRGSLFLNNKLVGILLVNSNDNVIVDNVYDSIREENCKNNIIRNNKLLIEVEISGNDDNIKPDDPDKPDPIPPPIPPDQKRPWTVCKNGSCDFTIIQDAVNNASSGDTIEVHSGTYDEHVNVNKKLTLQGVNTGDGLPVVDAGDSGSAITISADGCTVEGFEARNSGKDFPCAGIHVTSNGNSISGNTAKGNYWGIRLYSSDGNTIEYNNATGNGYGISLQYSCTNSFSANTANSNSYDGIFLYPSCNNNTLLSNIANDNGYDGIFLSTSCNNNTLLGNIANDNSIYGIHLVSSSNNNISENTAAGNSADIRLDSSKSNTIYLNNFDIGWSDGANTWNSPTKIFYGNGTTYVGNRWSGYSGMDCDGDGIGDAPYNISGGSDKDYHPIGGVLSSPALEAHKSADRSEAEVGDWINYTVYVNNTGNVTLTGVRAEDNLTGAVWMVGTLAPGQNYTNTNRYRVNQSDLPGPLVNELRANGTDPCGIGINDSAIETVNIIGQKLLCISGYKIDGCTDEGIADWEIILKDSNGDVVDRTSTNETGYYQFCDLDPGEYNLSETIKPGWTAGDAPGTVTLDCENVTNQNFTNFGLVCISGYKIDGCDDEGIADWEIILKDSNGDVVDRTTTNETGYYQFCDLDPGKYNLSETIKPGWNAGSSPGTVTLDCENVTNQNFTNFGLVCISGYKVDGCTGEALPYWNISLTNGSYTKSILTGPDGKYKFCDLWPGDYELTEDLQDDWMAVNSPETVSLDCEDATNQNFTNQKLLCISGKKINACTGNGLSGWDIIVKNSSTGLEVGRNRTITGGIWQVCGLVPGEYQVSEVLKSGYKNITNLTQNVPLNCENKIDINFINMQLRTLGGRKIDDCTGQGLNGWTIVVYNATTNTTYATTTSTISGTPGSWRITNLIPGYYQVSEVLQSGWMNVTPTSLSVLLPCNRNKQDVDFHNRPLRCVSGYKLDACTGAVVSGWMVTINNSTFSDSIATDINGRYEFCNLVPGQYTLTEEIRSRYTPVGEASIGIALNCTNLSNQNFTNQRLLCIGGHKYNNCTSDPLAGWDIGVYNATTQAFMGNDTTDGQGYWEVCNLTPGEYIARETLQPGWENHAPSQRVTLVCENNTSIDFFNTPLMCIGGYKYDACNGFLQGWELILSNSSGELDRALTNASGYYQFCNLSPGVYRVCEVLQEDWMALGNVTCKEVVLGCENRNDVSFNNTRLLCISGRKINNCTGEGLAGWEIILYNSTRSEIDRVSTNATGHYSFCSLVPDQYIVQEVPQAGWKAVGPSEHNVVLQCSNQSGYDFNNTPLLCISGRKTNDVTGEGLSGWEINITDSSGQMFNSATTNETGYYQFCNLLPDTYTVCEVLQNGWIPASAVCRSVPLDCSNVSGVDFANTKLLCLQGRKINDCTGEGIPNWSISYCNVNAGCYITSTNETGYFRVCNLTPGIWQVCEEVKGGWRNVTDRCVNVELNSSDALNLEFRNAPLGCLSGYKKNEQNVGLAGWTIEVGNSSGLVATALTDGTGFWQVCNLDPGEYDVSEAMQGNYRVVDGPDNPIVLGDCGNQSNINFTNTLPGCIEGFKLNYSDGKGLEGWTIEVRDSNGDIKGSTITDSTGHWQVCNLENGTYTVCEVKQPGWMQVSPINPDCYTVVMEGQNITDKNFTNMKLLCLSGHKFHQRTGEGLSGWTIVVSNATNRWEIVTDATGFWQKCNLTPGQYTVCEVLKNGWINVTDDCQDVELECEDKVVNFENIPASLLCIKGTKYDDCTDEGLANWTIDLKDSNGVMINSTLTDANGDYSFCGLMPGSYTVCEKLLSGWKNVTPSCIDVELRRAGSEDNDFRNTNRPLLCISGYKLNDSTKEGLEGWEIVLTNATGEADRATTNATGYYQFCGLEPGSYGLYETPKPGYVKVEIPSPVKLECYNRTDQNFTNRKTGGNILTVCKNGDCNFTIIQDAINNASTGNTIEVHSGTYQENVNVNKPLLILQGVKDGSDLPVVDAGSKGSAITLSADGCTLQGFNARNPSPGNSGIKVISDKNTIIGNIVTGNSRSNSLSSSRNNAISGGPFYYKHGILLLESSSDNIISGNTATGNDEGIHIESSHDNIISGNKATDNTYYGIALTSSSNNTLSGNTATGNNWGIYLTSSSNNNISDNKATDNNRGIHLSSSSSNNISDNKATGNDVAGIYLHSSSNNAIWDNNADDNPYGIFLTSSSSNIISDNDATDNGYGIYIIYSSSRNTISGNTATRNNDYGIYLDSSSGNIIYLNILNNIINAWSNSANQWNSPENDTKYNNYTGNYWSDYDGTDFDPIDGIGDQPYFIKGGSERDNYPIMNNTTFKKSGVIQISLDGSLQTSPPTRQAQYLLKVTNLGDSEVRDINITNQLSPGIAGISVESGQEPDITLEPNGTHILNWQDPGPLGPGESRDIGLLALLEGPLPESLISRASVRAISADGRNLSDEASLELNAAANISIEKEADPVFAQASDPVSFRINVSNTGQLNLTSVQVKDTLPQGMSYLSDDSNGTASGLLVSWDLGFIQPGESRLIGLAARVDEDASGLQINTARVSAATENGTPVSASDFAEVDILSLNVSKEADRKTVKRGENITYTITICNDGSLPLNDVVAWDAIDKQLILLYSSMDTGEDGKWHLGTLAPGQCAAITLIVQVPESNFRFDMTSSVSGVGFVNVADDYSTTLPQFIIKNTVYASSSSIKKQSEDTAMVTVLGEAGTELSNREHGSGTYQSEEELRIITENKSIQQNRSMAAMHQPVTLSLYGSRTLNSSSLWTDRTQAKNRVTGLTMTGSVSHAKSIRLDSRIKLDENESVMERSSEFEGQGQFGTRKNSEDGKKTFLDSQDDYAGSFKVYQKIDEYGSGLSSRRSASGTGFVAGDRRVGSSQRSHEAGTGNYSAEEAIETYTNFIHKDINLSSSPVDLSRTVPRWPDQSSKWTEGVYSRDPGKTYLGEEYSSLTQMDKETLVAGLNYIQSQANFTGKASYRQAIEGATDLEQEYLGRYSIRYKTSLQGTAKFDRPHINVIKEGQIVKPENQSRTYARYEIIIENDGNEILSPIYVNDLFPPGAVYVNSSLRPSLAESSANWSITHLPVGGRSEITLWLEIGENLSNRLVNRVQATGSHAAGWASAGNISVLECGWLPCATSQGDQIAVKKRAFVNESASDLVWYLLRIENHGNCTPSLTVTDSLPRGMKLIGATPDVTSYDRESNTLFWNIVSLKPNDVVSIIYQVQLTAGGKQVNQVKVEAISPEGCDINPAYDSTVLILGQKNAQIWPDDWKPPEDWGFQCVETSCV